MIGGTGKAVRPNTAEVTRSQACSNCGRDMNPGPLRHSTVKRDDDDRSVRVAPNGTCIWCIAQTIPQAEPRGRRIVRGSTNRGARKKARAYARRRRVLIDQTAPRVRQTRRRIADRYRSSALTAVRKAA